MSLEERVARIEGILEQMDKRLLRLENEVVHVREVISRLRGEVENRINDLRGEMRGQFRWIIGIIITMWITVTLTILFSK